MARGEDPASHRKVHAGHRSSPADGTLAQLSAGHQWFKHQGMSLLRRSSASGQPGGYAVAGFHAAVCGERSLLSRAAGWPS